MLKICWLPTSFAILVVPLVCCLCTGCGCLPSSIRTCCEYLVYVVIAVQMFLSGVWLIIAARLYFLGNT